MIESEKILFVDDESKVLDAIQRQLFDIFGVETALGPQEGLACFEKNGPYAVVVSDMRMPGMDGATLLGKIRERWPDTVRIMLTGYGDIEATMRAVNQGNIFRFLTKPCEAEELKLVLEAGLAQYRLIKSERDLLENTLKGAIEVLMDILALSKPLAFSRARRIKALSGQIARLLNLPNAWRFEVSGMLSQIGCIAIPEETLAKVYDNQPLSEAETKMLADYPLIGGKLLSKIPRLDEVAEIILQSTQSQQMAETAEKGQLGKRISTGAQILRIATEFERLLSQGKKKEDILKHFKWRAAQYDSAILNALEKIKLVKETESTTTVVKVLELRQDMVIEEDVRGKNNILLVKKGQQVTEAVQRLLFNYYQSGNIGATISVSSGIIKEDV